jgi:hypothetical protein
LGADVADDLATVAVLVDAVTFAVAAFEVGEAGALPVEVGAPSLALAAFDVLTAWWAWLIADW